MCLSTREKNRCLILVRTFLQNGGCTRVFCFVVGFFVC